jgi:phosphotransferase family enzyme
MRDGRWMWLGCRVIELRRRRETWVAFCRLRYLDRRRPWPCSGDVALKLDGRPCDERAATALTWLAKAGLCAPGMDRVPRLYGCDAARGVLIAATAPGTPWRALLVGDHAALLAASARAARWLAHMQALPGGAAAGGAATLGYTIAKVASDLLERYPWHVEASAAVRRLLAEDGSPAEDVALVAAHGDFHPGQVFIANERTTVIDWDTFGAREPASDVGYCMAQLLAMSYFDTGTIAAGVAAARAFWGAYRCAGGAAAWRRVRLHAAGGLAQVVRYALSGRPDRADELLGLWARLMACWLGGDERTIFAELVA